MTIDWTQLILAVIGILSSGSITTLAIIKYTKKKEDISVKSDDNKEQAERIDLGDKYVNQMLAMLEKLQTAQEQNLAMSKVNSYGMKESWDSVNKKMEEIHGDVSDVKCEVSSIVQYLNGGYKQYKAKHPELK